MGEPECDGGWRIDAGHLPSANLKRLAQSEPNHKQQYGGQ